MKLTIQLNLDNAAFGENHNDTPVEVARILYEYAEWAESRLSLERVLRDINGNTVGNAVLSK